MSEGWKFRHIILCHVILFFMTITKSDPTLRTFIPDSFFCNMDSYLHIILIFLTCKYIFESPNHVQVRPIQKILQS